MNLEGMLSHSIGMFDSGLGGLTVMRQLLKALPHESLTYFGDTARLPYGEKSRETIIQYSLENAQFLLEQQIKMLVVACSTASAFALDALQERLEIPVLGMIEPGAKSAVLATTSGRIAILGTKGTIQSQAYQQAIFNYDSKLTLFPVACPLFVPFVEEQLIGHPAARLMVKEYLQQIKGKSIDVVLLGCTHYPFLKELICEELGSGVTVIDPAMACAEQIKMTLTSYRLNAPFSSDPKHRYFVSDDPEKFHRIGQVFLGDKIPYVERISNHDHTLSVLSQF